MQCKAAECIWYIASCVVYMTLESCIAGCIDREQYPPPCYPCLRLAMSFSEREKGQNIPIRSVILRRMYPPSLPPLSSYPVIVHSNQFH